MWGNPFLLSKEGRSVTGHREGLSPFDLRQSFRKTPRSPPPPRHDARVKLRTTCDLSEMRQNYLKSSPTTAEAVMLGSGWWAEEALSRDHLSRDQSGTSPRMRLKRILPILKALTTATWPSLIPQWGKLRQSAVVRLSYEEH